MLEHTDFLNIYLDKTYVVAEMTEINWRIWISSSSLLTKHVSQMLDIHEEKDFCNFDDEKTCVFAEMSEIYWGVEFINCVIDKRYVIAEMTEIYWRIWIS